MALPATRTFTRKVWALLLSPRPVPTFSDRHGRVATRSRTVEGERRRVRKPRTSRRSKISVVAPSRRTTGTTTSRHSEPNSSRTLRARKSRGPSGTCSTTGHASFSPAKPGYLPLDPRTPTPGCREVARPPRRRRRRPPARTRTRSQSRTPRRCRAHGAGAERSRAGTRVPCGHASNGPRRSFDVRPAREPTRPKTSGSEISAARVASGRPRAAWRASSARCSAFVTYRSSVVTPAGSIAQHLHQTRRHPRVSPAVRPAPNPARARTRLGRSAKAPTLHR